MVRSNVGKFDNTVKSSDRQERSSKARTNSSKSTRSTISRGNEEEDEDEWIGRNRTPNNQLASTATRENPNSSSAAVLKARKTPRWENRWFGSESTFTATSHRLVGKPLPPRKKNRSSLTTMHINRAKNGKLGGSRPGSAPTKPSHEAKNRYSLRKPLCNL
ncbi:hypothetical protein Bca52824_096295 [Brassica carinata]|uniref:Uncharacterized protein n=1 Tax=Brassica carinata TaxID=52824 RepID=A0A8X7P0W1_BRACI|nr:hypothetical protein Bca52824_096295 [Brassica carinata]